MKRKQVLLKEKKKQTSRNRKKILVTVALLVVLCCIAFHNAFPDEFVLDAVNLVRDNLRLQETTPWSSLWTSNYWGHFSYAGLWRPLTFATFRVEYTLLGFDGDPVGYVAVNLILHILAVLLLWRVVLWISSNQWIALGTAVLFSVHPAATEVVPNIVGRSDLLVTVSILASLLFWKKYVAEKRVFWLVLVALTWLCGLLSKENAVVLPVLLVLADGVTAWPDIRKKPIAFLKGRLPAYSFIAVVGAGWFFYRLTILGPFGKAFTAAVNNPLVLESPFVRIINSVVLMGSYLVQAVWPIHLCADYSHHTIQIIRSVFDGEFLFSALALIGLLVVAGVCLKKKPAATFGCLFFLVTIIPLSNLIVPVGIIRADRFLYLASIGLFMAIVAGLDAGCRWVERYGKKAALGLRIIAIALPAGLLMMATIHRNSDWHNNYALWQHTVMVAPENVKARHNLALNLIHRNSSEGEKELVEIARHLEKAVDVSRDLPGDEFFEPYINLGNIYLRLAARNLQSGQLTEPARWWMEKAVDVLQEGIQRTHYQGRRYASWQDALDKRAELLGNLRPAFGDAKLHLTLATALDSLGRPVEAGQQLRKAIEVDPVNPTPYLRLAILYARARQTRDVEILLGMASKLRLRTAEDVLLMSKIQAYLKGVK